MAVTISVYNKFKEYFGDGTIDLDDDTFKAMLMNTSHVFTATHTQRTNVSANQIATGNGYTQATGGGTGLSLASTSWSEASGTLTFNSNSLSWTASGGSIVASDLVVFDDTASNDELCWSVDFDGEQTAADGTTFLVSPNASGWFQF